MSSVNIETLLYDELDTEFAELSKLTPGSEEHKVAADTVAKMMDRAIEIYKIDRDYEEKAEARKSDELLKQKQLVDEKRDRLVKNIIGAAGIALPLLVTIWGTKVSLKFEEEGTFTTIMGRGFINKLLPKK